MKKTEVSKAAIFWMVVVMIWPALIGAQSHTSNAGLVHLKSILGLKELNLKDTLVSDAGLVHLNSMKNLEKLDLSKTMVTKAGIAELQKALPNLTIEWSF